MYWFYFVVQFNWILADPFILGFIAHYCTYIYELIKTND